MNGRLMYNRAFITAKEALKECLRTTQYQPYWHRSVLFAAWHRLFPHLKNQLKKLFLKKDVLYVSLESLILANDLRRNVDQVLSRLQEEIKALGEDPKIVSAIVFL